MRQLLITLALLYSGANCLGQTNLKPSIVQMSLGYGISALLPNGYHLESTMYWDKPIGWLSGMRITPNFESFEFMKEDTSQSYISGWSWYTGVDYQFLDDFTKHKLSLNASVGMAIYLKPLTGMNLLFEPTTTVVSSPFLRIGGRYQYQFGIIGVYAQPWVLFGKKRELGGDIGLVLRRSTN